MHMCGDNECRHKCVLCRKFRCSDVCKFYKPRECEKLNKDVYKRQAISKLPLEGDIKKMQGVSGYRLRVGTYRILFDVNGLIVDIIDIGNRGQIYKGV